jgi:hypothetical protein
MPAPGAAPVGALEARALGGTKRIAGLLPRSGNPGTAGAATGSYSPRRSAPTGHDPTQAGSDPSLNRWAHKVHLRITLAAMSNTGASYGQTQLQ